MRSIEGPILITGGSGFVGANLARRMHERGLDVDLFLRGEARTWRLDGVLSTFKVHRVDLLNARAVNEAVEKIRPKVIFHLAAYGAYPFQNDVARILKTNFEGTVNLLEACASHGFQVFINAGSSSEYGWKDHPMREDECIDPNSYYAVAKAAATHYCRYTALSRKLPVITVRLFSVYGPWEDPTRFIPTLAMELLKGTLPPLVAPETARDFIYVDDVLDAYEALVRRPDLGGEILNVGTGRQITIREAVETALSIAGVRAEPQWGAMPKRTWDTSVWVSDPSKIQKLLPWQPKISFRTGLEKAFCWFKEKRALYELIQAPV